MKKKKENKSWKTQPDVSHVDLLLFICFFYLTNSFSINDKIEIKNIFPFEFDGIHRNLT